MLTGVAVAHRASKASHLLFADDSIFFFGKANIYESISFCGFLIVMFWLWVKKLILRSQKSVLALM